MEAIKFNNYYRNINTYSNIKSNKLNMEIKEAIVIIYKLIEEYKDKEKFYNLLLSLTDNEEDIRVIKDIMEDKLKHNKITKVPLELNSQIITNKNSHYN